MTRQNQGNTTKQTENKMLKTTTTTKRTSGNKQYNI